MRVLNHVAMHNAAVGQGIQDIGGSNKTKLILLCLAETLAHEDRKSISNAASISILRDERKGTVAIRFVAVDGKLETRAGLLGFVTHLSRFGVGAECLVKVTDYMFKKFSTRFSAMRNKT